MDSLVFSFRKFYPNTPYKVIHILNLTVDLGPENRADLGFRVLFSDMINNGYYRIVKIPPYWLNRFTLGTVFKKVIKDKNTTAMSYEKTGIRLAVELTIENPIKQVVKKFGEVLNDKEYPIYVSFYTKQKKVDFTEEIKNQYCVLIEKDRIQFVFPLSVIGAKFFYVSPRFTENLFNLNLVLEYHKVDINKNTIHIKGGFNNIDAPFLYLYATDSTSKKVYESVGKMLFSKLNKRQGAGRFVFTIKETIFPFFAKDVEFVLRGEFVSDNKFLVYEIERFDFSKILKTNELTVLRTEKMKTLKKKMAFFKRKDANSTGNVNDDIKTGYEDFFEKLENYIDDIETENFILQKKMIPYPHEFESVRRIPIRDESEDVKDLTFNKYGEEFPSIGKGINTKVNESPTVSESFSLEDFWKYFKKVCYELQVNPNIISRYVKSVNVDSISIPRVPLTYFKSKKIRKYLILKFMYKDRFITVLEVDHSDLLDNKLYTFIFSGNRYLSDEEVFRTLHLYLDKSNSLRDIENYFETVKLIFYKKRHPKEYTKKALKDWVDTFVEVLKYKVKE